MKKQGFFQFFAVIITVFCVFCLKAVSEEPQSFTQIRKDGSVLKGYLSAPSSCKSFPIAILCEGSYSQGAITQSVYPFHQIVAKFLNPAGIGLISIEKRGVDKDSFDPTLFHEFNVIKNRENDYQLILNALRNQMVKEWDSRLILIGTSEGGWIAPRLAHLAPETLAVLIFGGAGAWKFKEEITFFLKKHEASFSTEKLELQFAAMQADPSPDKFWMKQTYKFWAQALDLSNREEILSLSCPTYLSIGSNDDFIESSDELWRLIQERKKENVTYARYEGLSHFMLDDRYSVFQDAVEWIKKCLAETSTTTRRNNARHP